MIWKSSKYKILFHLSKGRYRFLLMAVIVTGMILQSFEVHAASGGMKKQEIVTISTIEELKEWYQNGALSEYGQLKRELQINTKVTLSGSLAPKYLDAGNYTIHIAAGGSMTVEDANLSITSTGTIFLVEPGGGLTLNMGKIEGYPAKETIIVNKNGSFDKKDSFSLKGSVSNNNTVQETQPATAPGESLPGSGTTASPGTVNTLTGVAGSSYAMVCQEGEPPKESGYPPSVSFQYQLSETQFAAIELPVTWNTDKIKNKKAGVYELEGIVSEDTLKAHGLKNPENIKGALYVTILKAGPLTDIKGKLLSVSASKKASVQLILPVLPAEVSAIYLYKSSDNVQWEKLFYEDEDEKGKRVEKDNFIDCLSKDSPTKNYVKASFTTNYRPVWMKAVLEGSFISGTTNTIKFTIPSSARPGINTDYGSGSEDGSLGGSFGSGGSSQVKETTEAETEESESTEETRPAAGGGRFRSRSDNTTLHGNANQGNVIVYSGDRPLDQKQAYADGGISPETSVSDTGTEESDETGTVASQEAVMDDIESGREAALASQDTPETKEPGGITGFVILACGAAAVVVLAACLYYRVRNKKKESDGSL